jgi:hypothetical protein
MHMSCYVLLSPACRVSQGVVIVYDVGQRMESMHCQVAELRLKVYMAVFHCSVVDGAGKDSEQRTMSKKLFGATCGGASAVEHRQTSFLFLISLQSAWAL